MANCLAISKESIKSILLYHTKRLHIPTKDFIRFNENREIIS